MSLYIVYTSVAYITSKSCAISRSFFCNSFSCNCIVINLYILGISLLVCLPVYVFIDGTRCPAVLIDQCVLALSGLLVCELDLAMSLASCKSLLAPSLWSIVATDSVKLFAVTTRASSICSSLPVRRDDLMTCFSC